MSLQETSGYVKAAIIGGIFAVIASCIGGAFLIINTLIANGFIISGPSVQAGNPNAQPTATVHRFPSTSSPTPPENSVDETSFLWSNNTKPKIYESCPVLLIDGSDGKVTDSARWISIENSWSEAESITYDINFLCSRRGDSKVHMLIGTTSSPYDDVPDKGYFTLDQARQVIEENRGKPIIIVPW